MDKKKFIGLIIGVLMFIALISGATFAWLTYIANFTNNIIIGGTRDFTFTYTSGTNISELIWTTSSPPRNAISEGKGYVTVSATKAAEIPEASSFKIILKKDTMDIMVTDLVKFAVCRSNTASECNNSATTTIPTTVGGNWVALGSITTETGNQVLYDDTTTFNVYSKTQPVTGDYYVYLWLDSAVLTNDNFDDAHGKQIADYVYAEAEQGENGIVQ